MNSSGTLTVALGISLLAVGALFVSLKSVDRDQRGLVARLETLRDARVKESKALSGHHEPPSFLTALVPREQMQDLLLYATKEAKALDVDLNVVSINSNNGSANAVESVELGFSVVGGYRNIKQLIDSLLHHSSSLTLSRLTLRADGGNGRQDRQSGDLALLLYVRVGGRQ